MKAVTPQEAIKAANECREQGLSELAEVFESIADKISTFNETHRHTIEEIRSQLGDDRFFEILNKTL